MKKLVKESLNEFRNTPTTFNGSFKLKIFLEPTNSYDEGVILYSGNIELLTKNGDDLFEGKGEFSNIDLFEVCEMIVDELPIQGDNWNEIEELEDSLINIYEDIEEDGINDELTINIINNHINDIIF